MAEPRRRWLVLVEETGGGGQQMRWRPVLSPQRYEERQEARDAALTLAREYQPRHPFRPGERTILRHDEDSYSVVVEGLTQDFHFRVSVAEQVE